ncbi:hypothetical protein [Actinomadura verrucosospora]|uniref:DUF2262 domain-containing protein n=1 Tax=Actinomadura verrucosospora TaxID=46165 RepID=A0A7D4A9M8_ACTVE|nr:hypothetical protein [Actinomadura verrucosospora]QKG25825.1 hypothetical protein ACTIVE_7477 [Actinomadura verrucosospora]
MTTPPPDRTITDESLGVFVREWQLLLDGERLDFSFYSLTLELDGRNIALLLDTADPAEARRLLPRLRRAVENRAALKQRAVEAVVHAFTEDPPTTDELTEAHADLLLDTIAADGDDEIVLHLTDSCGKHFLDGYWPAVRFTTQDTVLEVTVEA